MVFEPLTPEDEALVALAAEHINLRYKKRWHHLTAALRTTQGEVFLGLHTDCYVSGLSICAEQVAVGAALTSGPAEIATIVAVRKPSPDQEDRTPVPVAPCGRCRELVCDYGPNARVILTHEGQLVKVKAVDLLPMKYYLPGIDKK